jgi:hypothetical protein
MSQLHDYSSESISLCESSTSDDGIAQTKLELGQHPQLSQERRKRSTLLIQVACSLWILPVVALLTLNFKRYIVGASAWCPYQDCHVGWFNRERSIPLANLRRFDKQDHNLLGALQFVAKALEIWFELIAFALVYLVTMDIAAKKDGLHIGFLTRPCEFSELPALFDPLLWKTLPPLFGSTKNSGSRAFRLRVYLFIGFTILLCILCNLMGPATAVLALPTLQWVDAPFVGNRTFGTLNAGAPPSYEAFGPFFTDTMSCDADQFTIMNFSCAADPYARQLDSWLESYIASGDYMDGQTQHRSVKFGMNSTWTTPTTESNFSDFTFWALNRQILSNLGDDSDMITAMSLGHDEVYLQDLYNSSSTSINEQWTPDVPDTFRSYNRSLQLSVQRNGPVIGVMMGMHLDLDESNTTIITVDDERSVHCYADYDLSGSRMYPDTTIAPMYTKCVQVGSGWSEFNKQTWFTVLGEWNYTTQSTSQSVDVVIRSSEKAQLFEDNRFPSWFPPDCVDPSQNLSQTAECDWDRLFRRELDADLYDRTKNITTIEMWTTSDDGESTCKLTVDFVAFLNFTNYQLDPSPITNPGALIRTPSLPTSGTTIHVDPSWLLAAWTVDDQGVMGPDHTSATELVRILNGLHSDYKEVNSYQVLYISLLPMMQALTLIDFTTEGATPGITVDTANVNNPLLARNAKLFVWAYGLSTRTSKLGVVVALLGIALVLVQSILGFVNRRSYRSPTQLLVAALEHAPTSEFKKVRHNEAKVASMRFHIQETNSNAGKYLFRKVQCRT